MGASREVEGGEGTGEKDGDRWEGEGEKVRREEGEVGRRKEEEEGSR